jgi:hypothetical protein
MMQLISTHKTIDEENRKKGNEHHHHSEDSRALTAFTFAGHGTSNSGYEQGRLNGK